MLDCIFCKISSGQVPSNKIYEDDKFFAFLDINPVAPGHVLVVPKEHHVMMVDTPDELLGQAFIVTKKIMIVLKKATDANLILVNVTGDEVPHFHIHLIPRHKDDGLSQWKRVQYKDGQAIEITQKIKEELN